MSFWVLKYNKQSYCKVHSSNCRYCCNGNLDKENRYRIWHGPFESVSGPNAASESPGGWFWMSRDTFLYVG